MGCSSSAPVATPPAANAPPAAAPAAAAATPPANQEPAKQAEPAKPSAEAPPAAAAAAVKKTQRTSSARVVEEDEEDPANPSGGAAYHTMDDVGGEGKGKAGGGGGSHYHTLGATGAGSSDAHYHSYTEVNQGKKPRSGSAYDDGVEAGDGEKNMAVVHADKIRTEANVERLIQLWKLSEITDYQVLRLVPVGGGNDGQIFQMHVNNRKYAVKRYSSGLNHQAVEFQETMYKALEDPGSYPDVDQDVLLAIRYVAAPSLGWVKVQGRKCLLFPWIRTDKRKPNGQDVEGLRRQVDTLHALGYCHLDITDRNIMLAEDRAVLIDFDCVCKIGECAMGPIPPESAPRVKDRDPVRAEDDEFLFVKLKIIKDAAAEEAARAQWSATFIQRNRYIPMQLRSFVIAPDGTITGEGSDPTGEFTLSGSQTGNEVHMIKKYAGWEVKYDGEVSEGGAVIEGVWTRDGDDGGFRFERKTLPPVRAVTRSVDAREPEKRWGGYSVVDQKASLMTLQSFSLRGGVIVGKGTDAGGNFSLSGSAHDSKVVIKKTYADSEVELKGEMSPDGTIEGTFGSGDHAGTFLLEKLVVEEEKKQDDVLQRWIGYYVQFDQSTAMNFSDFAIKNGQIVGSGTDPVGDFTMSGIVFNRRVHMTKQYSTHMVEYKGALAPDGSSIDGTWHMQGQVGGFRLEKIAEMQQQQWQDTLVEATSGHWAGHYVHANQSTEMQLSEFSIISGNIAGRGSDPLGDFSFRGKVINGRVVMTKAYGGWHVEYEGELSHDGSMIDGTWRVTGDSGEFHLENRTLMQAQESGKKRWIGYYMQNNRATPMNLAAFAVINGKISGRGSDPLGSFVLRGRLIKKQAHLTKSYPGYEVEYKGEVTDDGSSIFGTWAVGSDQGGFRFTRLG